jgi:hypothetical protein
MASAIELIVDSYVQLGDRDALQILLDRRQKLAFHLQSIVGYDVGRVLQEIKDDIVIISAGLVCVDNPVARAARI